MSHTVDPAILNKVRTFPAMSQSATRLLELLGDPDASVSDVEVAVRYDPGLTANLLKLANSAFFGQQGTIASVRDAVLRLGMKRIFQLVMTYSTGSVLSPPVAGYDTRPGEMWLHCIAVSVATERIAAGLGLCGSDEIFTAALLHDVGKLVLGEFVGAESATVATATSGGASFDAAERQVLGVDHGEIGALILEDWSLPEELVSVVRWHHRPEELDPPQLLVDVVHVADMLCMSLGYDEGREGLHYRISPVVAGRLGIRAADLERFAMETMEGTDALSAALGLGDIRSPTGIQRGGRTNGD